MLGTSRIPIIAVVLLAVGLGVDAHGSEGCGFDDPLFQKIIAAYVKLFFDDPTNIVANICREQGRNAITELFLYIEKCPALIKRVDPTYESAKDDPLELTKFMDGLLAVPCAMTEGNCSLELLSCWSIDAYDFVPYIMSVLNIRDPNELYQLLPVALHLHCGQGRKIVQCIANAVERGCPKLVDHIRQYSADQNQLTGQSEPLWEILNKRLKFLNGVCDLKKDDSAGGERCVVEVLVSVEFAHCLTTVRYQPQRVCGTFDRRKKCVEELVGKHCGTASAHFLSAGLPLLFPEASVDCALEYIRQIKET